MIAVKQKFRKLTIEKTKQLLNDISNFSIQLDKDGPGSVQNDLDKGFVFFYIIILNLFSFSYFLFSH